jgi:hypothetical protein
MSSISAGTTTGTALVSTGDTTGQLVLKTNGTTTAVTIGTDQVVTLAQALPVASGGTGAATLTANAVLVGNGTSAVQVVAPGTTGNILTSNGTAWTSATPAGGGSWVLISSIVASGSSTVDFTSGIDSTYKNYAVIGSGLSVTGTAEQPLLARVRTEGTFRTANYGQYLIFGNTNSGNTTPSINRSYEDEVGIVLAANIGAQTSGGSNFIMYFSNPSLTTQRKLFYGQGFLTAENNFTAQLTTFGGLYTLSTAAVDGLRFVASGGTLNGTFSLYGIKTS